MTQLKRITRADAFAQIGPKHNHECPRCSWPWAGLVVLWFTDRKEHVLVCDECGHVLSQEEVGE